MRTLALALWSDTAPGDLTHRSRWCPIYLIALLPSTPRGACNVINWPPRIARCTERIPPEGEAYAFSEMADRARLLREFYTPA